MGVLFGDADNLFEQPLRQTRRFQTIAKKTFVNYVQFIFCRFIARVFEMMNLRAS